MFFSLTILLFKTFGGFLYLFAGAVHRPADCIILITRPEHQEMFVVSSSGIINWLWVSS